MHPILLTPPSAEPVALADMKTFIRVEHSDDDALIGALIASARLTVEALTGRLLSTQVWRLILDRWPPSGEIRTGLDPIASFTARICDADGVDTELDEGQLTLVTGSSPARLRVRNAPVPGLAACGIEIDVICGYGEPDDVPQPLRHAVRLLAADWYERRGAAEGGQPPVPPQVVALCAPWRIMRL